MNNFILSVNCLYSANNSRKCNFKYVAILFRYSNSRRETFSTDVSLVPWYARVRVFLNNKTIDSTKIRVRGNYTVSSHKMSLLVNFCCKLLLAFIWQRDDGTIDVCETSHHFTVVLTNLSLWEAVLHNVRLSMLVT